MSIGEKLLAVMDACRYMPKDGYNEFQKYHYTTAAGLFAKVNEALTANRLYIAKVETTMLENRDVTTQAGKVEKYELVKFEITIGDVDSEEKVTFSAIGGGQDAGDKASMKAQSAAKKYAYMGGFCIAMADDPEEDTNTTAYPEPPKKNSTPAKTNGDGNEVVGKCEICGGNVTAKNMYYANKNYDGHKLCYGCQQDIKNGKKKLPETPPVADDDAPF